MPKSSVAVSTDRVSHAPTLAAMPGHSLMTPSDHQNQAVRAIKKWYRSGRGRAPIFRMYGFAGSGKSSLARFIVDDLGIPEDKVAAACFAGKAAHVLRGKGFPQAGTIHSLIYTPISKDTSHADHLDEYIKALEAAEHTAELIPPLMAELEIERAKLRQPAWGLCEDGPLKRAKLLVMDEASMCGQKVAEDLLSFGVPILALGDPAQLPPVGDGGYFTGSNTKPDFMLTEIHRQAKDSAVIRLATMARETGVIPLGIYKDASGHDSEVTDRADSDRLFAADQILVGLNATRHRTNAWWRKRAGRMSRYPIAGDRLVCLKNRAEAGLMNGATYVAMADAVGPVDGFLDMTIMDDDGRVHDVKAWAKLFGGDPSLMYQHDWVKADGFDFAYAMTCHKAQGSSWPHVAIAAEWPHRDSWRNWLYTALTRASVSNYVVMPR